MMQGETEARRHDSEEWRPLIQNELDARSAALSYIYEAGIGADISNFDAEAVVEKLAAHPLKHDGAIADQYYNHISYLAFEAYDFPDSVEEEYLQDAGYNELAAERILEAVLDSAPQQCLDEHLRCCSDKHFDRLIAKGADPENFSEYGQNALHKAAEKEDRQRIVRLIEAGMDPSVEQRGEARLAVSFSPDITGFMADCHRAFKEQRSLEMNTPPALSLPDLSDPATLDRMASHRIASPKRPMRL